MHRANCKLCKLDPADLAALERAYVGFVTLPELAELFGVPRPSIVRHCALFSLDLVRANHPAVGAARVVELGLDVEREDVTVHHALTALSQLHKVHEVSQPPPAEPGQPGDVLSWERELRLTIRGKTRDDTRPTLGAGDAGEGEADELTYHGKPIVFDADQPVHTDWPDP